MLTLTKKELTRIGETPLEYAVHLVAATRSNRRWWSMQIRVPTQKKVYRIVTYLGETKFWKRLDLVVHFIQESCPNAKEIIITLKPPNQ
ncbi:hypothetical protein QTH90_30760 [Variovorax sp. J2P1-59]|uniref:hypothetical protein n=1 Tax=Variovorax flavidus TaxID=3053501 RepID=UPI00257535ED|nr:hypothetical protein [Variovorax sp. J2P1-59]MDM0078823.1 hypothetical protein [Variovorax sp. J2P1-59]